MSGASAFRVGGGAAVVAAVLATAIAPVSAEADPFAPLMISPARSLAATCRNGVVALRVAEWRRGGAGRPAFGTGVADIVRSVSPPELEVLVDRGCDPGFLRAFRACTVLDDPAMDASGIARSGKTASTDAEMAEIITGCFVELGVDGVHE